LDRSLHPEMLKYTLGLFNSDITNPKNAQLIFTTHNTVIIDKNVMRSDQLWFAEKDDHATSLYSLNDFKGAKVSSKEYLMGKYGALPWLFSHN
jgi:hypothetical protein